MDSYFVNLSDNSIHNFSLEGTEYNGFVFDGIQHKTSAGLYYTCSNIIDCGYCNNKAIPEKQKRDIRDSDFIIFINWIKSDLKLTFLYMFPPPQWTVSAWLCSKGWVQSTWDGGESHAPKRSVVMEIEKTTSSYIKIMNVHLESVWMNKTHCINNIIDWFRLLIS